MKLCFIANGQSPHTKHWIDPLSNTCDAVYLLSYKHLESDIETNQTIDLTNISTVPKLKYFIWCLWIRKFLKTVKPDILHVHQIQPSGWLGVLSGYKPLIVSAWGSDLYSLENSQGLRKFLEQKLITSSSALTVPSSFMAKIALEVGFPKERVSLIPWGVDRKIFTDSLDDRAITRRKYNLALDKPLLLSTRAVTPTYNQDIILATCKSLRDMGFDFQIALLRFNPDEIYVSGLNKFIEENGLSQVIRWLEPINNPSEMAKLYRASDVMISIPESEGFGLSVYEAMACGCPTIITQLDVFRDLVNEFHTLFVPARDILATRKTIIRILTDNCLRKIVTTHGIEYTFSMDISKQVEKTLNLYQSIITGSNS